MNRKMFIFILLLVFLQPTPSYGYSNADISEALTYSGCNWGLILDGNQFPIDNKIKSNVEMGLGLRLVDEGLSVPSLDKFDVPRVRVAYNNLLQSWSMAGTLSTKWKPLESAYERGLQAGIKKWNSGSTFGVSSNAAFANAGSKLIALCRIAEVGVKSKSAKLKLTTRQYVIKVSGNYLPQLP